MLLSRFLAGTSSVMMILGAGAVSGQDFPNKPIRIVTAPAGGANDFTARLIASGISASFGQPVIVDNRNGGYVPVEVVMKAPPDGYSMLFDGASFWIQPIMEKMPYDVLRDFSPISSAIGSLFVLATHPSLPVNSVKELIALAKAKPGVLNYASGAVGSTNHLAAELFKAMAGVNIVRIPYKSAAARVPAVMSGEVQMTIADVFLVVPHVKSGKVKALAVTSAEPSALTPGMPTLAAAGLPGYEAVGISGLLAPIKTPSSIIKRLNHEIVRVLNGEESKQAFATRGAEVIAGSPEQFATLIKTDIAKWGKLIRDAGIKAD